MMNRDEARRLAHELVAQMTLEEKASQLRFDSPAIPRLGIPAYNWWNEALHGVASSAERAMPPRRIEKRQQKPPLPAATDPGRIQFAPGWDWCGRKPP